MQYVDEDHEEYSEFYSHLSDDSRHCIGKHQGV